MNFWPVTSYATYIFPCEAAVSYWSADELEIAFIQS